MTFELHIKFEMEWYIEYDFLENIEKRFLLCAKVMICLSNVEIGRFPVSKIVFCFPRISIVGI